MNQESFEDRLRRLTPREPDRALRDRLFSGALPMFADSRSTGTWLRLIAPAVCLVVMGVGLLGQVERRAGAFESVEHFQVGFVRLAPWSEPMSVPGVDVVRRNAVWPTFASTNLMGTTSSRGFSEMMVTEFVTR